MKLLGSILLLLLLVASCNKTEEVTLVDPELTNVLQRVLQECRDQSSEKYAKFKEGSSPVFGNSTLWVRHRGFRHEYKSGSTIIYSNDIRVWKSTTSNLYLFIENHQTGGSTKKFFLRLESGVAEGANDNLIDDIQTQGCLALNDTHPTEYSEVSGGNSGPLTLTKHYVIPNSDGTKKRYSDTYVFDFNYPAWVGSAWRFGRSTVKIDVNGHDTTETESFSSTFVQVTTAQDDLPVSEVATVFQNTVGDATSVRFCDLDTTTDTNYPGVDYTVPFSPGTDTNACPNTVPVGWTDFAI